MPASLETLLTSAAYTVNNNLAVNYSELTVTAMGIAQKVLSPGNYVYQGFGGMLWAQPITEAVMMAVSLMLLIKVIGKISDKKE
ncbi:MAG: hypothetical protein IKR76_05545 [Ruminococcus sp.]|nr:hypothetical protein [Ruminococcus sp.]